MATYFVLNNLTSKGWNDISKSPERIKSTHELAKKCGTRIREFYMCMGPFEGIYILDAPDDMAAEKFVMALNTLGNVHSTLVKTISETEYRTLCLSMGSINS